MQCHYCNRKYDCANESRPGVVSETLTPETAARKAAWVASQVPQLSVVGIAGPGDALADPRRTFETCARIAEALPDVRLCLPRTAWPHSITAEAIVAHAIDHVTITINAIDPAIAARIYAWVSFDKRRRTGEDAARILIERQLLGLDALIAAGVLVKVNSVMIPGINDAHLKDLNTELNARGAFLHNVMPLISDPAHGTHFGLTGRHGPTAVELKQVQDDLAGGANLMKHCRQCRADAVGLLGDDQGPAFSIDRLPAETAVDHESRRAYRAVVERERKHRDAAASGVTDDLSRVATDERRLFAVCTKGSGRINQHFGHAREFQIYEADRDGVRRVLADRRAAQYRQGGYGESRNDGSPPSRCSRDASACSLRPHRPRSARAPDGRAVGIRAIDHCAHEYIET
ncbi:MAG: nitrogenase cofactor biosynthesis protein NifB, partial [Rhodospirillales bacterium]|nr:nitrogenase cofactor biosynthesis protein NifB [Rhodospirillales bacterium]